MHNWVEIDLNALANNYRRICEVAEPAKVIPVIKSDAYGHGMVDVAKTLSELKVEYFAVSKFWEAVKLRDAGITQPIVILSGLEPDEFDEAFVRNVRPVVFADEHLEYCHRVAKKRGSPYPVHVKIDTGMGRLGFQAFRIKELTSKLSGDNRIFVEGIMTHFADADSEDKSFTEKQCELFQKTLMCLKRAGIHPPYVHAANSAATFTVPRSRFNWVRPGLALYGPTPFAPDLKPVMSLKAKVLQIKEVASGTSIGYGRTFIAPRTMRIATVSVGYSDGYPRSLSNKGSVLINGHKCNIVGRISMNLITVDVTHLEKIDIENEVVLLGNQKGKTISADEIAGKADTISYEIYCRIGCNPVRRIFPLVGSCVQAE